MLREWWVPHRNTRRQLRLPSLAVIRLVRVQYHADGKVNCGPGRGQQVGALAYEGCGAWGCKNGDAKGQVRPCVRNKGRELRDVLLCEVSVDG